MSARQFLIDSEIELKAENIGIEIIDSNPVNIEAGVLSDEYDFKDRVIIGVDAIIAELEILKDIMRNGGE